ncbi:LmbE family N-acetylglucosaminyl deacetylase [Salinibacter ruber]|uniref:PIG-L deacetylase family protein n=1 Tax=Salinibacter ruber TaxID=146919 RepID=UPI002167575A|nr:LmbE family N-acetylglucosaminyl deacetylase [Salinibacter ruber]MCS3714639.1 LmbE family N-acetylglucosaminyl deacetylase [Salinibacter ruber]
MASILAVVAHPDDETLGCGATLCRHKESGDKIYVLSLTDGVGARGATSDSAAKRREAAERAAGVLGFEWVAHGDFPDNALDSVPLLEIVQFIESVKEDFAPDLIYTHHGGDLNIDHRIVFQAVLTAFRPKPREQATELRTFEVASSTEWSDSSIGGQFTPDLFVDVSEHWDAKLAALNEYDTEIRNYPHSRSMKALRTLSKRRGAQVGLPKAEAFETVRRIVR